MTPFRISEWLENPERKVVTRFRDHTVRIVYWHAKGAFPVVGLLVPEGETGEQPFLFTNEGRTHLNEEDWLDLFFDDDAQPQVQLTGVAKMLKDITNELVTMELDYRKALCKDDYIQQRAKEIFDEVCKEVATTERKGNDKMYFMAIFRLVDLIEDKIWKKVARGYAIKIADTLEQQGFLIDARILRDHIRMKDGENISIAIMDGE